MAVTETYELAGHIVDSLLLRSDFNEEFTLGSLFFAGKFLGSAARPLLDWPLDKLADAPQLKITEMRAVGDDWRVTAIPVPAVSV